MHDRILIDLCCKAGGASVGFARAGFTVIGIDVEPQPRYPYRFIQADLRDLKPADLIDLGAVAVAASPPCKVHTSLKRFAASHHVNLIPETRELLRGTGLPYVIENVPGAPLINPVTLCGSMFGLGVRRHRLFEISGFEYRPPACRHAEQDARKVYPVKRYHSGQPVTVMSGVIGCYGRGQGLGPGEVALWRHAMGIEWMIRDEISQAIPPAYTEAIGRAMHDNGDYRA